MIHKLSIKDPTKTPVSWFSTVKALQNIREIEFKPGINVLWGRNGAGKSTLIKVLARLLHCEQSNHPVVTQESLSTLTGDGFRSNADIREGVELVHDGQGTRHFDPGHAVGLIGGGAAFDGDFTSEGVLNAMFRGSSGQTTMNRFDRILTEIVEKKVPEVVWKVSAKSVNELWQKRIELAQYFLEKNGKKGPPTILLDEPERSCDLGAQIGTWRFLRAYAEDVQFIVASHSLLALRIPDANYIEISPGYLRISETVFGQLEKWPQDRKPKLSNEDVEQARKLNKARRK